MRSMPASLCSYFLTSDSTPKHFAALTGVINKKGVDLIVWSQGAGNRQHMLELRAGGAVPASASAA